MTLRKNINCVVFDYGNTLVEFGTARIRACDRALAAALARAFGPVDFAALQRLRHEDRLAPYAGDPPAWRENRLEETTARAVRVLYGRAPTPAQLEALLRVRRTAFLDAVTAPPGTAAVLARLRERHRLAELSNYPDGDAIRERLRRTGLAGFFEQVLVSGDLGLVKPHPRVFTALLEQMDLEPAGALFVGDNWLADVQGARRAGMPVVWSTQWEAPEEMPRAPDDLPPHAVIRHLDELPGLLA